jgi:LmbE family N-acetylglucosaminyl deacetylase
MRIKIPGMLLPGFLAMACAGTSADPLTGTALDPGVVYFVENHGGDHRNLEQITAKVIKARGIMVTAGGPGQQPANATFVVTYVDRWAWDMRTYLRDIRIEVRNAKTGAIVADARSYQGSLSAMGDSYQEIVQRTAQQLFDGAP